MSEDLKVGASQEQQTAGECGVADPALAANLRRRRSALLLPHDADDLLLAEPALAHRPPPRDGLHLRTGQLQGSRSMSSPPCPATATLPGPQRSARLPQAG